ncbi:MAG: hypothetical protein QW706_09265 [Candidatus Nezhaarchaeales archaeon]
MRGAFIRVVPLTLIILLSLAQPALAQLLGEWTVYIVEWVDDDAEFCLVTRVIDGDTVELEDGRIVRLVGYDAYELSEPKGPEARQALLDLLISLPRPCYLDIDDLEPYDAYGRVLGYLWCLQGLVNTHWGGFSYVVNVNKWFLTKGIDYVKRVLYIPPDEHPWWTWLTSHRIVFGVPSSSFYIYFFGTEGSIYDYHKYTNYHMLNILSGKYNFIVTYHALNHTFVRGFSKNLISTRSSEVIINLSQHIMYTIFVRGGNDKIYYNLCNASYCGYYYLTLPGSTVDSPAAVLNVRMGNRIYLAVRGRDNGIWVGHLTETTSGEAVFSGWNRLPGSTLSRPVLTSSYDFVFIVVRGSNNRIYYGYLDTTDDRWRGWRSLPSGSTIDAPAAVYLGGRLHIVVRGSDGYSLWHSWVDPFTGEFSGWFRIPGSTPSAPYLTTDGEKLYLAVRGRDNKIYFNVYDGSKWVGWTRLPTGSTSTTPAIFVYKGVIHFLVVGMDGRSIYYASMNLSTRELTPWVKLPGSTPSTPTPVLLEVCYTC